MKLSSSSTVAHRPSFVGSVSTFSRSPTPVSGPRIYELPHLLSELQHAVDEEEKESIIQSVQLNSSCLPCAGLAAVLSHFSTVPSKAAATIWLGQIVSDPLWLDAVIINQDFGNASVRAEIVNLLEQMPMTRPSFNELKALVFIAAASDVTGLFALSDAIASHSSPEVVAAIVTADGLKVLIKPLPTCSSKIGLRLCKALRSLASRSDRYRSAIRDADGMVSLLTTLARNIGIDTTGKRRSFSNGSSASSSPILIFRSPHRPLSRSVESPTSCGSGMQQTLPVPLMLSPSRVNPTAPLVEPPAEPNPIAEVLAEETASMSSEILALLVLLIISDETRAQMADDSATMRLLHHLLHQPYPRVAEGAGLAIMHLLNTGDITLRAAMVKSLCQSCGIMLPNTDPSPVTSLADSFGFISTASILQALQSSSPLPFMTRISSFRIQSTNRISTETSPSQASNSVDIDRLVASISAKVTSLVPLEQKLAFGNDYLLKAFLSDKYVAHLVMCETREIARTHRLVPREKMLEVAQRHVESILLKSVRFRAGLTIDPINRVASELLVWLGVDNCHRPMLHIHLPSLLDDVSKRVFPQWTTLSHKAQQVAISREVSAIMDSSVLRASALDVGTISVTIYAGKMIISAALLRTLRYVITALVDGYPRRIAQILVGPVTYSVRAVWLALLPVMPASIVQAIVLMKRPQKTLASVASAEYLPKWWSDS